MAGEGEVRELSVFLEGHTGKGHSLVSVSHRVTGVKFEFHEPLASAIRQMIAAEREACAKIAEENTDFRMLQNFGMQSMCDQLCTNIASALRQREKE